MALTKLFLDSKLGKKQEKTIRKADAHGLGVRITVLGKVVFTVRYRYGGLQTSVDIGEYPYMTLAEAREKAFEIKRTLSEGKDPAVVYSKKKLKTFRDYAEAWFCDYLGDNNPLRKPIEVSIRKHSYPIIADIVPSETPTHQMMELMLALKKTVTEGVFLVQLAKIKQILSYATKFYELPFSPVQTITSKDFDAERARRERYLTESELSTLMSLLNDSSIKPWQRTFFLICLHTGCRTIELAQSRKEDFDFEAKEWTVPRSKNDSPIIRPLCDETIELIQFQISLSNGLPWLYTTRKNTCMEPNNSSRIRAALEVLAAEREVSIAPWVMHDLRRTVRTHSARWGSVNICELMLGHSVGGIRAVYDKYRYIDEMRVVYEKWISFLQGLKKSGA